MSEMKIVTVKSVEFGTSSKGNPQLWVDVEDATNKRATVVYSLKEGTALRISTERLITAFGEDDPEALAKNVLESVGRQLKLDSRQDPKNPQYQTHALYPITATEPDAGGAPRDTRATNQRQLAGFFANSGSKKLGQGKSAKAKDEISF